MFHYKRVTKHLTCNRIVLFIIICFFILRVPYLLINAFVPDEVVGTSYMHGFHMENFQACGAIYWVFGYLLTNIFGEIYVLFIMRTLSILSLCIAGWFIYKLCIKNGSAYPILSMAVWFTLPMVWYGGKLIFPEFYSLALIALSAYYLLQLRANSAIDNIWWLVLGFTLGLKLSAIIALFSICVIKIFIIDEVTYRTLLTKTVLQQLIKYFIFIVLGFTICNPHLLWDPVLFVNDLTGSNVHIQEALPLGVMLNNFYKLLFYDGYAWDLVAAFGINSNIVPFMSFLLVSVFVFINVNFRTKFIYLTILLVYLLSIHFDAVPFIWHSFQSVIVIFFFFMFIKKKSTINTFILYAIIIVNSYYSFSVVYRDYISREEFATNLKDSDYYTDCVANSFKQMTPTNIIIDFSEFGSTVTRPELIDFATVQKKVLWIDNMDKASSLIISPYVNSTQVKKALDINRSVIVLLSSRYKMYWLERYIGIVSLQDNLALETYYIMNTEYKIINMCKNLEIGEIIIKPNHSNYSYLTK